MLDFGQGTIQNGVYGTNLFDSAGFASVDQIRKAAVAYANGYYYGTGSDYNFKVTIAIGTNNYNWTDANFTVEHGKAWASMVTQASNDIVNAGYSSQTAIVGGIDAETSFSAPYPVVRWADGYDVNDTKLYVNFGDAGGCPQYSYNNGTCGSKGWTQQDVFYVSWGAPPAVPAPEIYANDGANARQWKQIALYAWVNKNSNLHFYGVMTQSQACAERPTDPSCPDTDNTPAQGWDQLYNELYSDDRTRQATIKWLTDISWKNQ